MTQYLPPNLLALFAPREPISFLPPPVKLGHEKNRRSFTGIAHVIDQFEDPAETPPPTRGERRDERKQRRRREKAEQAAYKLEQDIAMWDPVVNQMATSDAFKTLFVARINYDTTESKLRREFEVYGPVRKIVMIPDQMTNKPRGYAFIEYEHERDMHAAYKSADGKKIDGRRVLVDVERARTVKGWLPRRLGGGLGGTRKGGPDVNVKYSGREDYSRGRSREDSREPGRGDRDRRGRDRSPMDRGPRGRRSRSPRDRRRSRSPVGRGGDRRRERRRSRDLAGRRRGDDEPFDPSKVSVKQEPDDDEDRRRRRSRSRSRDRKRRQRSRSRERRRHHYDRSERGVRVKDEPPLDPGYRKYAEGDAVGPEGGGGEERGHNGMANGPPPPYGGTPQDENGAAR